MSSAAPAFNTMLAIKKKMHGMKLSKETAMDMQDQQEQKLVEQRARYEKQSEEALALNKRIVQLRQDVVLAQTNLQETQGKLESAHARMSVAEGEVQQLSKRVRGIEEEFENTESRLGQTQVKLEQASKAADDSERGRKVLEARTINDEERIMQLEKELESTIILGEEADRKYEETARRLAIVEVDLERAVGRVEIAEAKIIELEEELKVVGNNMKSLEIAEQEAIIREEHYEQTILMLTNSLKAAEDRATDAERAVNQLQKEVDRLEDELGGERDKFRVVTAELDITFTELTGF